MTFITLSVMPDLSGDSPPEDPYGSRMATTPQNTPETDVEPEPDWHKQATAVQLPPEQKTLAQIAIEHCAEKSRKNAETGKRYLVEINRFLEWCTNIGFDPETVTRSQINAFLTYLGSPHWNNHRGDCTTDCVQLKKAPYGNASIQRRLASINGFFEFAVSVDRLIRNPARGLSVHVSKTRSLDTIDAAEGKILFEAAGNFHRNILPVKIRANRRNQALVALLLGAGLRREEAVKARAENLGFDKHGRPTLTFIRKGGDEQTIPLPLPVYDAILITLDGRTEGFILTGDRKRRNEDGVLEYTGMGLTTVNDFISELGVMTGIRGKELHPHLLRKSAITMALTLPETAPYEVMTFFGHKEFTTTIGYDAFAKVVFKDAQENTLCPRDFWLTA